MHLLVTEITDMHQGNYCVATWCPAEGRMVRPLSGGRNWTDSLLSAGKMVPGAWIKVTKLNAPSAGVFPHRTEDTLIDATNVQPSKGAIPDWFGNDAPPSYASLSDAFSNLVQTNGRWNGALKGAYVQEGSKIGSLSAVQLPRGSVRFYEDDFRGNKKLRVHLTDGDDTYSLPVVASGLTHQYRQSGPNGVAATLPKKGRLHIRVGLARAWPGQPGKCTVMVNGIWVSP